ncbi:MAG: hypothetical protein ABF335_05025 [Alphaproteobacteria bacterium]
MSMKHAGQDALDQLAGLLADLRKVEGLVEKKRGIFYRKSRAFLHFHEDPSGLFADLRLAGVEFDRHDVTDKAGQAALLSLVQQGVVSG